ncbi:MAG: hypothetical protein JWR19_2206 [Pedosphaera sp.]|nr:hypothetical protein [Pedosphaera sp.]
MSNVTIKKSEIENLDKIAANALSTLGIAGSFEQTFAVADAMVQLREAITPAMMERFVKLQNTKLGFMTDKNPKVWNKKDNAYNKPYAEDVVKDCVIEATMRGVKTIGNQFNIIASGCYITKEGFQWKLKQLEGFADFKPATAVPRISSGGAIVDCEASWTYKGKPDSMKASIACKGDEWAGADSYIGKAERKFYKRIYERLTGTTEPDGEAEAETNLLPPAEKEQVAAPQFGKPATEPVKENTVEAVKAPNASATTQGSLMPAGEMTPQESLEALMNDAGVTFDAFRTWAQTTERLDDADKYGSWSELPTQWVKVFSSDHRSVSKCITLKGTGAKK